MAIGIVFPHVQRRKRPVKTIPPIDVFQKQLVARNGHTKTQAHIWTLIFHAKAGINSTRIQNVLVINNMFLARVC